jgi:hypothetical protein
MAGPSRAWLADAPPRSPHPYSADSPRAQLLSSSRRPSLAALPTLPSSHPAALGPMQLQPPPPHMYPQHMAGPPGGPMKHPSPSHSSPYHMGSPHAFGMNAPYPGSAYPGSSYDAPGSVMAGPSFQPDEPHPAAAGRKAPGKRARSDERADTSNGSRARADSSSKGKAANGGGASQPNGKRRKQEAPEPAPESDSESESDDGEDEEQSDVEVKSKGKKKGKAKRNRQACTHCQKLKMKCSGSLGEDQPCERCARTGHQCIVHERTYRRPWTRRMDGQLQELTQKVAVMQAQIAELQQRGPTLAAPLPAIVAPPAPVLNVHANGVGPAISPHGSGSGPLIFEPDEDVELVTRRQLELPFLKTGLITPAEAVQHFRRFMDKCMLHVVLIDPEWLTLRRALESSVFLFTTIVWLSSAYDEQRRDLVDQLQPEMDLLIGQVITRGCKSVEVVQGFLLLYFWNRPSADPEKDKAWLYAGIAIRLAVEKSLHLAKPGEDAGEQRNRERTMIMTFVVDRSLSLAVGKPWTIQADSSQLVMDCNAWCEHPMARSWDMGISALADLLKVTSKQTDALRSAVRDWTEDNDDGFDCSSVMLMMNEELEQWRRRWDKSGFFTSPVNTELPSASPAPTNATDTTRAGSAGIGGTPSSASSPRPDIHVRTLHYITKQASMRYNFAVLVLNSFGLQYCATRPRKAAARTLCVPRAISAAQNVLAAARDGLRGTMALSPHTQFVILSFALVSLIKLSKAPPIGDFASERLVTDVQSGIDFLDSISMSPTHTPARLASLLRLLLRNSRSGGAGGADDAGGQRTGSRDGEGSSRTERRSNLKKPAYAPGMEVHRLPPRSSRAVTPHAEPDGDSTPSKSPASLMAPTLSFSTPRQTAASATQQRVQGQHVSFSEPPSDPAQLLLHFAEPGVDGARRPFASDTPSNGVALTPFGDGTYAGHGGGPLSPLPLDFSLLGANGSTALGQMTAEEILDDSFWLRLG